MIISYRSEGKKEGWNEDAIHSFEVHRATFVCIADGQQSAPSFSASKFAVDYLERWVTSHPFTNLSQLHYVMNDAFMSLNSHFSLLQGLIGKMFSTALSVAVFLPSGEYTVYHTGNCAIYKVNAQSGIVKLTNEHTLASEMLSRNEIAQEDFVNHPSRAALTKYLGFQGASVYDAFTDRYVADDRFLLMTDGVYRVLSDEEILEALYQTDSPEESRDIVIDISGERQQFDDRTFCLCWVN